MDNQPLAFYEYLDQIVNLELKAKRALQGATQIRYAAARKLCGRPLSRIAADLILRLSPSSLIFISTGAGNPATLPKGETDGPSGVAFLTSVLNALGYPVCIVSENHFLPAIMASLTAMNIPIAKNSPGPRDPIGAFASPFPLGPDTADEHVRKLLDQHPKASAAIFIEKPGPNAAGVFHTSGGKPKQSTTVGHVHRLAEIGRERGLLTIAVGDGGNEIGFGRIRAEIAEAHPLGQDCGCPCHLGILNGTEVDCLFPAAVSNWGAYAIATAITIAARQTELLPKKEAVGKTVHASLAEGANDGYSGLNVPLVDGTSLEANEAVYQLCLEVARLSLVVE
jgi:hypothetical protein